jgi:hypothetical protein
MKKRTVLAVLIILLAAAISPALCQIPQEYPELCGNADQPVPLPPNLSVAFRGSTTVLTIGTGGSSQSIGLLPETDPEVQEVCPILSGRLAIFGLSVGYAVNIVNPATETVDDAFMAYDPAMSPDRRWIASRAFYPPQREVRLSEEYLLYDLTAGAKANWHNPFPASEISVFSPRGLGDVSFLSEQRPCGPGGYSGSEKASLAIEVILLGFR